MRYTTHRRWLSSSRRIPAFTLVELLVVIVIIALLIAILLPALQYSRPSARHAVCLARLRQHGVVMMAYAVDNNGLILSRSTSSNPYTGYGHTKNTAMKERFEPYISSLDLLYCPSEIQANPARAPGAGNLGYQYVTDK